MDVLGHLHKTFFSVGKIYAAEIRGFDFFHGFLLCVGFCCGFRHELALFSGAHMHPVIK